MQEKNRQLLENTIATGALQLMMYLIPLVTLPYQTRVLGVEKFGLIAFATSFIQYFILFVDYGLELSAIKEISSHRANTKVIANIFNSVLAAKVLLFSISAVILIILTFSIPQLKEIWLLIVLSYFIVLGNVIFPSWFFIGIERMKYVTFLNIISRSLFMVLLFVFIKSPDDYLLMPVINSTGAIVAGLISLRLAIKRFGVKLFLPKLKSIIFRLKYSTKFFFAKLSGYGTTNTNTFCLGLITSKVTVGYYVAAYNIYWAVNLFAASFEAPFIPYMNNYRDLNFYKKIFPVACLCFGLISVIFYLFAKPIILIFYGQEMLPAYTILKIFCINLFITRIVDFLGYPLLGAFGYINTANNTSIFTSVLHIIGLLILFLTKHLTMYSVAYLIVIVTTIHLMLRIFFIGKYKIFSLKT